MSAPWPRTAAFGSDGLSVAGVEAAELAARYGTPLVVVDEAHVRERCRAYRDAFGRVLWAVKAFPAGALIRLALEEGLGLLAATGGEMDACFRAGAGARSLVFHGNNKSDAEIDRAVTAGVALVIVDNQEELERIAAAARRADTSQPVLLRIVPGLDVETHAYVATGVRDTKFGISLAEGIALAAMKRALELPELELRGIHLHVGSQLLDAAPYVGAVDVALDFLAEARDVLGYEAAVLDLGGGMGVTYTGEEPVSPDDLAGVVRSRLERGCAERGLPAPETIVEPGRAVTGNAAVTLYTVGTIKEVPGVRTFVAVDGGMSDNVRPALYGARYALELASRESEAEAATVTVVGRHCESGDVLARDVLLPADLRRGDLLAVASTGAYEYAMASNYNKAGRPAVVVAAEGRARLVLRREDESDLARLEVLSGPPSETERPADVEIRVAGTRDARGVVRLVASVAAEGRYIRSEEAPWSVSELRRRLRRSWTREGAQVVAVAGRVVVGHLSVAREEHPVTRHVASIGMSVASAWRGRGVGSALLAEAVRWARSAGVEKLTLSVFPHNDAALALYRKFGFVEEGRLAGQNKKAHGYEDEILMGRWV